MGMTLVNGYVAFKYMTKRELTLSEFTNGVALTMCANWADGGGVSVAAATRGARQAAMESLMARGDPGDLPHTLFNWRSLGLGGTGGEGQCRLCLDKHASGVCKICSHGLDTDQPRPFWVCYPGKHGRQCYCQHLTVAANP